MARKSTKMSRIKNIEPSPLTISLKIPVPEPGSGIASAYVDLSQCASLIARRFYRQGLNWGIAGMKISSSNPGTLVVSKIPNTWVAAAAWTKAFNHWNRQQMDAVDKAGAESAVARFRDFKVLADPAHLLAAQAVGYDMNLTNLLPIDFAGNAYAGGEWQLSEIVIPNLVPDASGSLVDPFDFKLHMVGVNNVGGVSRGIIEGYADSRAYPQSPDPVSPDIGSDDNWLQRMFDVGADHEEILDNATDRNDDLPYPQVNYPGGETQAPQLELHDISTVYSSSATTSVAATRIKGGNMPCGLIRFDWTQQSGPITQEILIQIDMIPGSHRGYLAEPMQEM